MLNLKDAGANFEFKNIAHYVLKILCLPSSNAVVKRIFRVMNKTNTTQQNTVQTLKQFIANKNLFLCSQNVLH